MVAVEDGGRFLQSTGFILWALACSKCLNGFDDKSLEGNEISTACILIVYSRFGCPSPSSYLPVVSFAYFAVVAKTFDSL